MNIKVVKILGVAFIEAAVLSLSVIAIVLPTMVVYANSNLDSTVADLLFALL